MTELVLAKLFVVSLRKLLWIPRTFETKQDHIAQLRIRNRINVTHKIVQQSLLYSQHSATCKMGRCAVVTIAIFEIATKSISFIQRSSFPFTSTFWTTSQLPLATAGEWPCVMMKLGGEAHLAAEIFVYVFHLVRRVIRPKWTYMRHNCDSIGCEKGG
jgi:hypothetical protein